MEPFLFFKDSAFFMDPASQYNHIIRLKLTCLDVNGYCVVFNNDSFRKKYTQHIKLNFQLSNFNLKKKLKDV